MWSVFRENGQVFDVQGPLPPSMVKFLTLIPLHFVSAFNTYGWITKNPSKRLAQHKYEMSNSRLYIFYQELKGKRKMISFLINYVASTILPLTVAYALQVLLQ
jgi:hypothetical protein